ncbi:MAG: hyaluronidase [Betaproteobacteria bacterium]|nr:MAG: hyaluronidase [Betaproteobacteria bacterium]
MTPPLGIVEGFFGPSWSWDERRFVLQRVAVAGFSRYLYAPKADRALRREWDSPYSDAWMANVTEFGRECNGLGVEFGVGISPYGLQDALTKARLAMFRAQITRLANLGVARIAILFDDMEGIGEDLASVQLQIVDEATHAHPSAKFVVCPSYYSSDIVLDRVFGARPHRYLETLGAALDPAIEVFWTGPEVCSRQISRSHLETISEQLCRAPTLWDNYPVNDGPRMSSQLHLRAFTGRDAANASLIAAHMINPALQSTLSLIPALSLVELYAKGDRYDYASAFESAAHKIVGSSLALALREDLLAFQDAGLLRLGARRAALRAKYAAFEHPAAAEVVAWLDGVYAVSAEEVQTQ